MDDAARFTFYEKIYFYELERKEKLISRLNLPLAILGVLLSFLSYMLAKAPSSEDGFAGVSFWIFYLSAVFCLLCGAYYFRSSWQLRDFDRGLPTLSELEGIGPMRRLILRFTVKMTMTRKPTSRQSF